MALEGRMQRFHERRPSPPLPGGAAARLGRERSPIRDDRYRDPYRDGRDPLPPPRRDDPYYDEYRRPPPLDDPYLDRLRDDRGLPPPPPRRDPYGDRDPYREPEPARERPAPPPPPPPECSIVMSSGQIRAYADSIERRLKVINMVTSITILPEGRTVAQFLEDLTRHGTLFALVLTSQNEIHRSLTLNILHGQPQEHRNMPLEDAMTLVARSFERYIQTPRDKAPAPAAAPRAPPPAGPPSLPFLAPEPGVSYLLNLLADNRQLSLDELEKVIRYLQERRGKIIGQSGAGAGGAGQAPVDPALNSPAVAAARAAIARSDLDAAADKAKQHEAAAIQQRQDLHAKILSLFNGSSAPTASTNVATNALVSQLKMEAPSGGQSAGGSNPALINFDNPSVQKALDSLIQNPQVLQNIASVSTPASGQPGREAHGARGVGDVGGMGGIGSLAGQMGGAQTSLSTGSRQPMYGRPPPMGQAPPPHYGGLRPGGMPPQHHRPY